MHAFTAVWEGTPSWPALHSRLHVAFLGLGSPLASIAIAASLLALVLRADAGHASVAKVMRSAPLFRLSEISYSVYLLHLLAMYSAGRALVPHGALLAMATKWPGLGFLLISCIAWLAVVPVAALMHAYVELPARRWLSGHGGRIKVHPN